MANGDITAVKVLYRHTLSGGRSASGAGANDKVIVVGELTASYVSTGIAVNKVGGANCFGVLNIDLLKLEAVTSNGVYTATRAISIADYDTVNQKIFYVVDEGAATPALPSDGHVVVLRFLCIGDDAGAPNLT